MNEQDVRALVREAIERHLGRPEKGVRPPFSPEAGESSEKRGLTPSPFLSPYPSNSAHLLLKVVPGSDVDDGMCVIEPAVRCNHCGFCQAYGH